MKKIFKSLTYTAIIALLVFSFILPVAAQDRNEDQVVSEFLAMQEQITNVLSVDAEGKYTYSVSDIEEIIYTFDFNDVNALFGTDYTHESFLTQAINDIETTVVEKQPMMARAAKRYCGTNKVVSGWNYVRVFADKEQTRNTITAIRNKILAIQGIAATGAAYSTATGVGAGFAVAFVGIGAYGTWFWGGLANNLENANGYKSNNCGTVYDQNTYIQLIYTTKNQAEWTD